MLKDNWWDSSASSRQVHEIRFLVENYEDLARCVNEALGPGHSESIHRLVMTPEPRERGFRRTEEQSANVRYAR